MILVIRVLDLATLSVMAVQEIDLLITANVRRHAVLVNTTARRRLIVNPVLQNVRRALAQPTQVVLLVVLQPFKMEHFANSAPQGPTR